MIGVDLRAQPRHHHVHDVGLGVEAVVPHVFEDHGLAHRPAGVAQQEGQQRELPRLEFDRPSRAGDLAGDQVQCDVTCREPRGLGGGGGPADERLHAGEQLGEGEGLREVVVSPRLQAAHPVVHRALRAQEENWHAAAVGAQALHEADAVERGQHHVHDRGVVIRRTAQCQAGVPVGRVIHRVTRLPEPAHEERGDLGVIFDNEHAHGRDGAGAAPLGKGRVSGKGSRPRCSRNRGRRWRTCLCPYPKFNPGAVIARSPCRLRRPPRRAWSRGRTGAAGSFCPRPSR